MNKFSISEVDVESNKKDIISLLQNADWNVNYPASKYEWKYLQAPYGKARCWLTVEDTTNQIIGISSIFPRRIYIDKKPIETYTLGDFYVDKKYRGFGPALKIQKKIFTDLQSDNKKKIVYGIANKLALRIAEKAGYSNYGPIDQYIKPLSISQLAEHKKDYNKLLKIKSIQKILDVLFSLTAREKLSKKKRSYTIEILDHFDNQFDIFWEKAIQGFNIISEKNSSMLNWKYTDQPTRDFKVFCLKEHNNLLGFIVYSTINNNHQIYDICFLKNTSILSDLLLEFSLFSREKQRAAIIFYYYGDPHIIKEFRNYNFRPIKYNKHNLILSTTSFNSNDLTFIQNQSNWNILLGDKY